MGTSSTVDYAATNFLSILANGTPRETELTELKMRVKLILVPLGCGLAQVYELGADFQEDEWESLRNNIPQGSSIKNPPEGGGVQQIKRCATSDQFQYS